MVYTSSAMGFQFLTIVYTSNVIVMAIEHVSCPPKLICREIEDGGVWRAKPLQESKAGLKFPVPK